MLIKFSAAIRAEFSVAFALCAAVAAVFVAGHIDWAAVGNDPGQGIFVCHKFPVIARRGERILTH